MKKIIILLSVLSIGCKTQNVLVQSTGLVANANGCFATKKLKN
jgi:gamma-glutamyltranspeptidase/glutathione hydrolase